MNQPNHFDIICIGGGPASFFCAIRLAELNPKISIAIVEQSKDVLGKVKISGGGRCNVTHACFEPQQLTENYPRGKKELLGPFHQFLTGDTMAWFEERGVPLKIEDDNRVFPVSDSSMSIYNALVNETKKLNVKIFTLKSVSDFYYKNEKWTVEFKNEKWTSNILFIGSGSSNFIWNKLEKSGHTIVKPVSSLFTFNIKHPLLKDMQGISFQNVKIKIKNTNYETQGAMLITHWGLSGPAILKLSAKAARDLADCNYKFEITINLLSENDEFELEKKLNDLKQEWSSKKIKNTPLYNISKRFWQNMVSVFGEKNWADLSASDLENLHQKLTQLELNVSGKSTYKDEFVTSGGVFLKEIDFKKFKSKIAPQLYLAGEVLDIDAVTGGFNFQACWTGGWIAAEAINKEIT